MTSAKGSIVLVEDYVTLREELQEFLTAEGYTVRGVDCGSDLSRVLLQGHTDLIILDLNLPEEDGLEIARRIKSSMPTVGLIILTARVRSIDRLESYVAGADVYLTKPTRPEELLTVVNSLLKRLRPESFERSAQPWRLDVAGLCVVAPNGTQLKLTQTEVVLMAELADFGRCVDHHRLNSRIGNVNQSDEVNKANLEVLVSRLRSKLRVIPLDGFHLKAVRNKGYQLGFQLTVSNLPEVKPATRGG